MQPDQINLSRLLRSQEPRQLALAADLDRYAAEYRRSRILTALLIG
jgi:hypothetical protein